jgi:hypothetical protein
VGGELKADKQDERQRKTPSRSRQRKTPSRSRQTSKMKGRERHLQEVLAVAAVVS